MAGLTARQRRRMRSVKALRSLFGDAAEHVVDNLLEPRVIADELRAEGHDVDVALANTKATTGGYKITCIYCGRTARLLEDPGQRVALCPACMRRGQRNRERR